MFYVIETIYIGELADMVLVLPPAENIGMCIITYVLRPVEKHKILRWE